MAKDKKVEQITDMEKDFAQWFTDVCTKAELVDYSGVKGCYIMRPYGYAIWENIQQILDGMFKRDGHTNVAMPMLIPESLLQKEKDHVEGFAPECAWVTVGGSEELPERLCIRPTSETLFCDHWSHVVHSWRDLPMLYNQWCSVLRWEKTTRPFLRGREFLWQEGHTLHATEEEARKETLQQLEVYADLCENYLAMPVIRGNKTDKEKFAGAVNTYTIECMMHDKKALQSGTSHYFGQGFAEQFNITFTDKDNQQKHPYQTSWGLSTRIIGGLIMTHGDNNGLVLPPHIAPIQVVIIPINRGKEQLDAITAKMQPVIDQLRQMGISVKYDDADNKRPGFKFADYELRGVPVRLVMGGRDLENNTVELMRRDTLEKEEVSFDGIADRVKRLLEEIQENIYRKAVAFRDAHIYECDNYDEFKERIKDGGFFLCHWDGTPETEAKIKEDTQATIRCVPYMFEQTPGVDMVSGKPATQRVIIAKAY